MGGCNVAATEHGRYDVRLVCRSCGVHEQCWLDLYGMLECKVHVCFEILLLLNIADMDCLFIWKAIECMSIAECSVY